MTEGTNIVPELDLARIRRYCAERIPARVAHLVRLEIDVEGRSNDMADMRRCIGSAKFGIEAHEAPVGDFPAQPSQKDGLGRMCKPHWSQYTSALRKAGLARKAAEGEAPAETLTAREPVEAPEPIRARAPRQRQTLVPEAGSQGDAG